MELTVRIRPDRSRGFVATCPALPGCRGTGVSREQARTQLRDAIQGYQASVNEFVPSRLDLRSSLTPVATVL